MTTASETKLKSVKEITMEELLESPAVRDVAIRFICTLRKVMMESADVSGDDMDLGYDINRLFMSIHPDDREKAFTNAPPSSTKRQLANSSTDSTNPATLRALPVILPKPEVPKPKYAPMFTLDRANASLRRVLKGFGSNRNVTFSDLKEAVEKDHLGGECVWREDELKVQSNNLKMWENRIQNELGKLRKADVLVYRPTRGDYFIF